ncbi:MAG TPA: hypothetical protein VJ992_00210, partial [Gemmatimonadales bacterium]|nr:hypothetical protein [Gemmatimonadales bacterium]
AGDPLSLSDFHPSQFDASVGGPLVRNKAFFFVDEEFRKASAPAAGPYIGQSANAGVPLVATQGDIDAFNAALQSYGLPTGTGALVNNPNPLANLFFRLDFSVGSNSRLVLRYLYNSADDNIFSRSSSSTFPTWSLSNNGYSFKNRTSNPGIQFFTNFSNGASNELLVSLNRIRDARDPNVLSPLITVGGFANAAGTGTYSLRSGSEQYSQGNRLNQDIWELTDNFTIPKGTHQITIGTRNELYKVYNLFAQSSYGVWSFDNLADFQNGVASRYQASGDLGTTGIAATFTEATIGLYAQDNWQATPNFNLTYGLRVDVPIFFDQPTYAPSVLAQVSQLSSGLNPNLHIPSGQLLWGPRAGFNWDVNGDQVNQIRGGAGLFTGTPAFVWMSNAFSNNGTKLGQVTCGFGNTPTFNAANANYQNPPLACADGTGLGTTTVGEVDVIGKNTKYPQVLRANLAYDRRLPENLVFSVEGIYTRGINDYFITNDNLPAPVGTNAHGRVMYGTLNTSGYNVTNYKNYTLFGPSYNGGVFDLQNTSNNYSWSLTGQLQKAFSNSWAASVAYTYSQAYDVQSFTSSRAISNWLYGRPYSVAQTDQNATKSIFNRPNRVVVSASYTFPWKKYETDISFSYIGQSGQPYTYLAGGASGRGDLNADGTNANDPIYIPTDATNTSEMQFQDITGGPTAAQQAAAFNQFIGGESCLANQRGKIMERNSCQNPWQNFLNMSVRQTLPHIGQNKLALEVSIFNVLNLLDSKWGVVKTAGGGIFGTETLLDVVAATPAGQPIYQFDTSNLQNRFSSTSFPGNSYVVQLGLRYSY